MLDSTVEIYVLSSTITSDGTVKKTWGYKQVPPVAPIATIITDVQPKSLSEAQLKQWGLSTLTQDAKVISDFSNNPYLVIGNRVRVDSDIVFDIRARNPWDNHTEYVIIPVQGE